VLLEFDDDEVCFDFFGYGDEVFCGFEFLDELVYFVVDVGVG